MRILRLRGGPIEGRAVVPPSKSYTHRALVAGALTGRRHVLRNPLRSDDTAATVSGLRRLGHAIRESADRWTSEADGGDARVPPRSIDCRESGTTLRLLTSVAALSDRPTRFDGHPRLRRRPVAGLLEALVRRGAQLRPPESRPRLPFTIVGPVQGGRVTIEAGATSQFASALLMTLPCTEPDSMLRLRGKPVSRPYVAATLRLLRHYRVRVESDGRRFVIPGGQRYRRSEFSVPPDASSAAFLWAGAAVTGGAVRVVGIDRRWPQADFAILEILQRAGAEVRVASRSIEVRGFAQKPIDVELTDAPDLVPLVAVVAATIPGVSRIRGVAHARLKESDRLAAAVDLVRALGGRATARKGSVRVEGRSDPTPVHRHRLLDHRVVMAAAVGALRSRGASELGDADAVRKSYPGFWRTLRLLGAGIGSAR
ncbi:MAG TPA: 3-phosphoshikimate 1-carboxyvinyltransferase [Thermoplasmata archaeon]|nr:3-phosphoshikimate 1-carboxyvinyltransferase [Thermoplasmata archaeon]